LCALLPTRVPYKKPCMPITRVLVPSLVVILVGSRVSILLVSDDSAIDGPITRETKTNWAMW
jgi:hypothetical protein